MKSVIVRLIHWLIAISVALNIFVLEDGDSLHRWIGYLAVGAVLARLVIIFRQGYRPPNIAARVVYIIIWSFVVSLGVTGFLMTTDQFWGDETLHEIHFRLSQAIQIFVVVHLLGIIGDSIRHKRKTWMRMISGHS